MASTRKHQESLTDDTELDALGLPPGAMLEERYRIIGELGEGGVGVVYEAEHLKLKRRVAIKVLQDQYVQHESMRPRFEREARALAAMSHPNIVSVTDYGLSDGRPYLVMELLEGQTLRDLLDKEGHLPEERALHITKQILAGLSYAHGQNLAHRDLKPGNVFLQSLPSQPDHAKILDFGFAKFVEGEEGHSSTMLSQSGVAFGTPAYMPPEQATGDVTDARTDVYSLGILFYEMLTGAQPFRGDLPEVIRQQLTAPIPPLAEGCPGMIETPPLRDLLSRACAKKRDDRFQDASAFLEAVEALPVPALSASKGRKKKSPGIAPTLPASGAVTTAATGVLGRAKKRVPRLPRIAVPWRLVGLLAVVGAVAGLYAFGGPSVDELRQMVADSAGRADPAEAEGPAASPTPAVADEPPAEVELQPVAPDVEPRGVTREQIAEAVARAVEDMTEAVQEVVTPERAEEPSPSAEAETGTPPAPATPTEVAERERRAAPPTTKAPAPARPAATGAVPGVANPWDRRPLPRLLQRLHRRTMRRQRVGDGGLRALREYARGHRSDPRASLLIARVFVQRGWQSDALERYQLAHQLQASSRGDPRMLTDLVELVKSPHVGREAIRAVATIYGRHARATVREALRDRELDDDARRNLRRLRNRIARRR